MTSIKTYAARTTLQGTAIGTVVFFLYLMLGRYRTPLDWLWCCGCFIAAIVIVDALKGKLRTSR